MKTIDSNLKSAKQEIDRLSKTLPTAAGQASTSTSPEDDSSGDMDNKSQANRDELVDATNQIFSLFRVNYHNQFYAAFSDSDTLNQAKRLWLNAIENFDTSTLLAAAKKAIESSEYLPTLHHFLSICDQLQFRLPDAHDAYIEACQAADNIATHSWSHPAIYHAGKATGWHFLRGQPEKQVFPHFREQFEKQKSRLRDGESLPTPQLKVLEQKPAEPLPKEEQKMRLAKLKATLDI